MWAWMFWVCGHWELLQFAFNTCRGKKLKKPVDRVPRITTTSQRSRPRAPQILATAPPSYRRYHRANNVVTETVDGMEEFLLRWADEHGW